MRKALYPILFACLTAFSFPAQAQPQSDAKVRAYIAQFKDLAISEQKRTGMPAAIKLAQGLHETGAGTSLLATKANNHFGMKCKKNWTGETMPYSDDAPNECFRKYATAEESYRDQGNYLRNNPRYATCFSTDVKDYKTWATELRRAGYATNPKYADKLTKTIEDYGLQQYTLLAAGETLPAAVPETVQPSVAQVVRQDVQSLGKELAVVSGKAKDFLKEAAKIPEKAGNALAASFQKEGAANIETYKGLQGFYATAGQSLLEEATRYNVRYAKLLEWNDLPDAPVPYDMFIFLEKKPARGGSATHVVKSGETLHKIAQQEAIQLASLRQLNMIDLGEEPQPGAVLQLQRGAASRPAVYMASPQKEPAVVVDVVQKDLWTKKKEEIVPETKPEKLVVSAPIPENPVVVNVPPAREEKAPAMPVVVEPQKAVAAEPVVVPEKPAALVPPPAAVPEKPVVVAAIVVPETEMTPPPAEKPAPEKATPENGFISKTEIAESPTLVVPVITEAIPPPPVATATPVVSSEPETPAEAAQPVYEDTPLGRLKAKMDRAVYAKHPTDTTKPEVVVAEKTAAPAPEKPKKETPAPVSPTRPAFHVMAKGETVFGIAKKYGISTTELRKWNGMDFSAVKVGQRIKLKP